ncbi:bifunctional 2',3'-cyclic-nucleotide 2'-phosphodiesterase/3'-nucleotidase [Paenibacillus doosanensis]|uniref:bifunctional 2',3'-cyclic-nucleotide 2'-phosphodiesterase/3'-nucleotidase n=1 Tax=Paenibacillus doosanensis TaxID=1229154 RepID=UPI0021800F50|nr:bifunctional 2',3'-cyclic-nucleotide 2'-phosphodiesterase/3'-nucleotidase [Paenibacillus doosanensis]MCS7462929.1 bifunctional 2',3'-cyclic-nucleotide 2'-phosphodiesterase/3'-nucleotidase [Paenibacillus doosanensis]
MRKTHRLAKGLLISGLLLSGGAYPDGAVRADGPEAEMKLRIMETSDIHTHLMNYDYYQDQQSEEFGFVKTASHIKKAREEAKNSLLFDNGDIIQGNPLGDYVALVRPLQDGETHPVYKALNLLNYDAGNIGNHEFNFGLDFLQKSLKGANFPYVNSNVYIDDQDQNPDNDRNLFTPYQILDRSFVDESGREQRLKIGVIGFVPPQIVKWDKANLQGKVIVKDIVESAETFVPKMKAEGADLIIAIPHSGLGSEERKGMDENASFLLSKVKDIDVILFGHAHAVFPSESFQGIPGVDADKGTINGIPAVEPGFWGNHLGIIDLTLQKSGGTWRVADSRSHTRAIYETQDKRIVPLADADEEVANAVKDDHEATLAYIRGPVGATTAQITSYFAVVQDDPSIQILTNAQKWYVEKHIEGTELDGIPVLSAGAPFKAGGRSGPNYYTDIPAGTIAVNNAADLYVYPNTLKAVLMTGAEVKEWLEMSALQFNQIDPDKAGEQDLINASFPAYKFDIIDGVTYEIDVTQPARYGSGGKLVNPDAHRIVHLQYDGKPIDPNQKFLVATNNYRASGGGSFPGLTGDNIAVDSPDENREILIDYIRNNSPINPSADGNWSLAPIRGNPTLVFESSPAARALAESSANIRYAGMLDSGFAKYELILGEGRESAATTAAPGEVYIVQPGDVLSAIALKYGMEWRKLAEYNELPNPHRIYPGQEIAIPAS